MKNRAFIATLMTTISLTGCFHAPYPTEWSALPDGAKCEAFSGTFDQLGSSAQSSGNDAAYLSWLLDPDRASGLNYSEHKTIERVMIDYSGEAVAVSALKDERVAATWSLPSNGHALECENGQLVYAKGSEFVGDEPQAMVLGVAWGSGAMSRAADGSLIIHTQSGGVGTAILVIPFAASGSDYFRFTPSSP